jgi:uncharacterized protein YndB with AHSA1/START domain
MISSLFKTLCRSEILSCAFTVVMTLGVTATQAQERPMLTYASTIEVAAPPQKVWDSFKDFDRIHDWHPATEKTVLLVGERNKALAVREFQLKGGGFVISELLNFSEPQRWFSYRILKTNLPMTNYVGEMWVESGKAGGSVIHWQAHFQRLVNAGPKEDDAATMGLVQAVFKAGLDNLVVLNK